MRGRKGDISCRNKWQGERHWKLEDMICFQEYMSGGQDFPLGQEDNMGHMATA